MCISNFHKIDNHGHSKVAVVGWCAGNKLDQLSAWSGQPLSTKQQELHMFQWVRVLNESLEFDTQIVLVLPTRIFSTSLCFSVGPHFTISYKILKKGNYVELPHQRKVDYLICAIRLPHANFFIDISHYFEYLYISNKIQYISFLLLVIWFWTKVFCIGQRGNLIAHVSVTYIVV